MSKSYFLVFIMLVQLLSMTKNDLHLYDAQLDGQTHSSDFTSTQTVSAASNSLPEEDSLVYSRPDKNQYNVNSGSKDWSKLLSLALHAVWVIIHCILLVTLYLRLESRIILPLTEESSTISDIMVMVSQVFVVVSDCVSEGFLADPISQPGIFSSLAIPHTASRSAEAAGHPSVPHNSL
jgi:hypothetical protein